MATRCIITIRDTHGREYTIYRHYDGHPEDVVSDLHLLTLFYKNPVDHPEYFLANFIFYAKLERWLSERKKYEETRNPIFRSWEYGYGVSASKGEPNNQDFKCMIPRYLDYKYLIYPKGNKAMLRIERFSSETMDFETIFDGKLERAFERYANGEGCHLKLELLS